MTQNLKEQLVGRSSETPLSAHVKAHFMQHARVDSESGELYMTREDFINAIAPKNEDYVSYFPCSGNTVMAALAASGCLTGAVGVHISLTLKHNPTSPPSF